MAGDPLKEHDEPIGRALSGGQAKQLIDEAGFACRSRRSQDAMATADHAHNLDVFDQWLSASPMRGWDVS